MMMNIITDPWPWYISGPLIALVLFLLLREGKDFGMSSNFRTMCSILGAGKKTSFFNFDWKAQRWNLLVVLGAIIGGFLADTFLTNGAPTEINPASLADLQKLGIVDEIQSYLPASLFVLDGTGKQLAILLIGGLLIGFGTRYAGGCSSGHAISGLSNFQLPSLIAIIGFFIGGLLMVHLIFPLLFG
ncbi:YeeE/YedE family protein [Rhinopithecimicrobium faecis]